MLNLTTCKVYKLCENLAILEIYKLIVQYTYLQTYVSQEVCTIAYNWDIRNLSENKLITYKIHKHCRQLNNKRSTLSPSIERKYLKLIVSRQTH